MHLCALIGFTETESCSPAFALMLILKVTYINITQTGERETDVIFSFLEVGQCVCVRAQSRAACVHFVPTTVTTTAISDHQ